MGTDGVSGQRQGSRGVRCPGEGTAQGWRQIRRDFETTPGVFEVCAPRSLAGFGPHAPLASAAHGSCRDISFRLV
jgi:hypothetical protein